jgi:hypothetical protein
MTKPCHPPLFASVSRHFLSGVVVGSRINLQYNPRDSIDHWQQRDIENREQTKPPLPFVVAARKNEIHTVHFHCYQLETNQTTTYHVDDGTCTRSGTGYGVEYVQLPLDMSVVVS